MTEPKSQDRYSPKQLHTRILVLEVVTFISLVLNLALWYFAGNLNAKVENRTTPSSVESH